MMRLPWFDYRAPRTIAEAARILAGEGPNATLIAGGTDLLPNMKRRQMAPRVTVHLYVVVAEAALFVGEGAIDQLFELLDAERFESKNLGARDERAVYVKERIVSGGAD